MCDRFVCPIKFGKLQEQGMTIVTCRGRLAAEK